MSRELLQQALDALNDITYNDDNGKCNACGHDYGGHVYGAHYPGCKVDAACDAIRAHLATQPAPVPKPEPVAIVRTVGHKGASVDWFAGLGEECSVGDLLYASPPAPVPVELVEAVAKAIYYEWRRDTGYVPWVDGGNSDKQDDARKIARAVVADATPVPVPLTQCNTNDSPWLICKTCAAVGRCAQACGTKPLSLDFIDRHIGPDEGDREAVIEIVRQVEAAHGIAASPEKKP